MLLGGELLHQQVCIIDNEAAENQSSSSGQDQICTVAVEEELQKETQSTKEADDDGSDHFMGDTAACCNVT